MNLQKVLSIARAAQSVYGELEGQAAHERLQLARTELFNALRDGQEALANIEAEWEKMKEAYQTSADNPEHVNEPVHPALVAAPGITLVKDPEPGPPVPPEPPQDPNQDGA